MAWTTKTPDELLYGVPPEDDHPTIKGDWKTFLDEIHDGVQLLRQDSSVTITVGSGGDYSTLNPALLVASRYRPIYDDAGITVIINMLTGFVMAEQVLIKSLNLGFIKITSDDAIVTIVRSALTTNFGIGEASYPAFGGKDGAVMPFIDTNFSMDTSGTATNRDGIYVVNGCVANVMPDAGIANAGGTGLNCQRGSQGVAHQGKFPSAGAYGIWAGRQSRVDCALCDVSNAGIAGLYAYRTSVIEAPSASDLSDCISYGAYAFVNSQINVDSADAKGAGIHGLYCLNGSLMFAGSADASNAVLDGIRAHAGSFVSAPSFTAIGCDKGIYSLYGSNISCQNGVLTGNTTYGARCLAASMDIIGANAQIGGSPDPSDIAVAQGGIIKAATATGGTNVAVNNLGASGIILQ